MQYLGDYAEDYATLNFKFSTHKADGTPIALAGSPAVSVYKGSGTTQSTAGITLAVDFDSVTGLNNVLIDLSADAFYAVANDYQVVITTGTVDSVSVVGTVLAHFSIENRFNETVVSDKTGFSLSNAGVDAIADEPYDNDGADISLREAIRIFLSVLCGLSTGGGTNTISFRDLLNTKNRVRMTVDANGNRTVTIIRDGT